MDRVTTMANSEVTDSVRLRITDCKGLFSHYGHFIHDFALSLYCLQQQYPSIQRIILPSRRDSYLHTMKPIYDALFDADVIYLPFDRWEIAKEPLMEFRSYGFGPYPEVTVEGFKSWAIQRLSIKKNTGCHAVLIERAAPPKFFDGSSDLKTSASQRRYIKNQEDVARCLQKRFGDRLKCIKLEEMSIKDQVELFASSDFVVGQHGAGLCNLFWMPHSVGRVIELSRRKKKYVPTFKNICRAKKLEYRLLHGEATTEYNEHGWPTYGLQVDIKMLDQAVESLQL